jgi:hypothetical protein
MAGARECHRIVPAQLDGALDQARSLGELAGAIAHPAVDLAPEVTPGSHPICCCIFRIELDRVVEQNQRLIDGLPGPMMQVRHCAEIVIVGVETFR